MKRRVGQSSSALPVHTVRSSNERQSVRRRDRDRVDAASINAQHAAHPDTKRKLKAASVSIGVNISLIIVKLFIAVLSGSIAILAEVLHSLFDLLASVFAFLGIKLASRPENEEFQYGHEKYENLSSLLQTLLIVLTSIFILYEAIHRIMDPHPVEAVQLALGIMLLTIIADFFVSRYLHRISSETRSSALEADAYHFTTDLWSAIAVVIGLLFSMIGYPIFDSISAIIVALLMLWVSYRLGMRSLDVMLDKSPPRAVIKGMERIIKKTDGVVNFHRIRVRQTGSKLFVDAHIRVNGKISVRQGHEIAHQVKKDLLAAYPQIKDVTLHIEPA